jgi:pantetheine-phosphate adenylyltransferase
MIKKSLKNPSEIEVTTFDGLTAEYAKSIGAAAIVRGIRAVSDFEYEFQMALMNRKLQPEVETVFLTPNETHSYISSSLVKDIARRGGDVSCFVPDIVKKKLSKKFTP